MCGYVGVRISGHRSCVYALAHHHRWVYGRMQLEPEEVTWTTADEGLGKCLIFQLTPSTQLRCVEVGILHPGGERFKRHGSALTCQYCFAKHFGGDEVRENDTVASSLCSTEAFERRWWWSQITDWTKAENDLDLISSWWKSVLSFCRGFNIGQTTKMFEGKFELNSVLTWTK